MLTPFARCLGSLIAGSLAVVLAAAASAILLATSAARGQCEVQQLIAPGPGGAFFGGSVSVSGDVAVVGDSEGVEGIGVAYVFRRNGLHWELEAELRAPKPDLSDQFGSPVAVAGDVVIVGAHTTDAPEILRGAAHIFRYSPDSSQWTHEAMLTARDGDLLDIFGWSVAL